MKAFLLRIGRPAQNAEDYPVTLEDLATSETLAQGSLPAGLERADVACPIPEDPGDPGRSALERILDFYATNKDEHAQFEAIGRALFELALPANVAQALEAGRAHENHTRTLLLVEPVELRPLPWELLYAGKPHLRGFLDHKHAMSRAVPAPPFDFGKLLVAHAWPLRVLLVIGCAKKDEIAWRQELSGLEATVFELGARVDLLVQHQPTQAQIVRALEEHQPHVFHFIGHGKKEDGDGCLMLDQDPWTVDDLRHDLQRVESGVLQLAIVNACHSSDRKGFEDSWAITDAIVAAGTPAVLGMQGDILGECAAEFSARVYQELLKAKPLDFAVARARDQVRLYRDQEGAIGLHNREWSLPQLHLASSPEKILRFDPPFDEESFDHEDFRQSALHLDRYSDRRLFYGRDSWLEKSNRVLLIKGAEGVGKSNFVLRCLSVAALRDHAVSFVDLREHDLAGEFDPLYELLDLIVKGRNTSCFLRPRDRSRFREFYLCARALHRALDPPMELPLPAGVPDDAGTGANVLDEGRDSPDDRMVQGFLNGLQSDAGTNLLVFDHVGDGNESAKLGYVKKLARAIHGRGHRSIRMVLVAKETDCGRITTPDFDVPTKPIELKDVRDNFRQLAEHILGLYNARLANRRPHQDIEAFVTLYIKGRNPGESWKGSLLGDALKSWKMILGQQ